jgi:hypothetical protein
MLELVVETRVVHLLEHVVLLRRSDNGPPTPATWQPLALVALPHEDTLSPVSRPRACPQPTAVRVLSGARKLTHRNRLGGRSPGPVRPCAGDLYPINPGTKIIPAHSPRPAADHRDGSATVVDNWTPRGPETSGPQTAPRAYPAADSNHR